MADDNSISHVLIKPIPGVEGEVRTLTFRQPTGGDLFRHGNPVRFDAFADPPTVDFDEKKLARMMSALSGVPESALTLMDPRDVVACGWKLSSFFLPAGG